MLKKKLFAALAVLLVVPALLVGCADAGNASQSPYIGKWEATEASMEGITIDIAALMGGELTFDLKANGTVETTIADESSTGKWQETEDGFSITDDSDTTMEVKVEGDTGTIDYDGLVITLVKQNE